MGVVLLAAHARARQIARLVCDRAHAPCAHARRSAKEPNGQRPPCREKRLARVRTCIRSKPAVDKSCAVAAARPSALGFGRGGVARGLRVNCARVLVYLEISSLGCGYLNSGLPSPVPPWNHKSGTLPRFLSHCSKRKRISRSKF